MAKRTLVSLMLAAALFILGSSCLMSDVIEHRQMGTATAEAMSTLTSAHDEEVRRAIERYEAIWGGIDARYDPTLLASVATGPHLESQLSQYQSNLESNTDARWIIESAVTVTHVEVLEYGPERFKAVADMQYEVEVITSTTGELARDPYTRQRCDVYVFRRDDGVWKCSASYMLCDERYDTNWEYVIPDDNWIKAEIGELPSAELCQCRYWWNGVP